MSVRMYVLRKLSLLACFAFFAESATVHAQDVPVTKEATTTASAEISIEEPETVDEKSKVPEKPPEPPPFILRPYEVGVFLTVSHNPAFSMGTDERLAEETRSQLQSLFRQMWNLNVHRNDSQFRFSAQEIHLMTDESLEVVLSEPEDIVVPEPASDVKEGEEAKPPKKVDPPPPDTLNNRLLSTNLDKVFFAAIEEDAGEFRVSVREWDASSKTLSAEHNISTHQRRYLEKSLIDAITGAFRPIAEVEVIDGEKVEFLIRAGELYPRDQSVQQFRVGDYLTPYMRYMNRKREVQRITTIPWTYLRVEEITRSRMRLKMTSAFRSPIPLSRRRVQVMGMRIKPHLEETTIRIYPRGNYLNPLVGVRCEIMDRLPKKDNPVPPEERTSMTTDRAGTVRVKVNNEHPIQYIVVYSGNSTLAQVPFIPGDRPFLEVEVPDDTARLTVEGEVALLQSELIDIIATREVLFARARGAAKKKDWAKVDQFLKDLEGLQTFDQYQARIETLRVQAVYAAQLAKDRIAEIRIKKLCDGILESSQKHLDPFRIAEFRREMNNLRRDS